MKRSIALALALVIHGGCDTGLPKRSAVSPQAQLLEQFVGTWVLELTAVTYPNPSRQAVSSNTLPNFLVSRGRGGELRFELPDIDGLGFTPEVTVRVDTITGHLLLDVDDWFLGFPAWRDMHLTQTSPGTLHAGGSAAEISVRWDSLSHTWSFNTRPGDTPEQSATLVFRRQ